MIGSALMQQYARAIGLDVDVVRQLFLRCKVQFHKREAARAAEQLKASSGKPRRLAKAGWYPN